MGRIESGSHSVYKRTMLIAVPVMIQNLITNFVAMIDNIMVGQIGTEEMSAVAIVNQILLIYNITIFGAVSGAGIFSAQYFGKGDKKGVLETFRFKILSVVVIALIAILIFVFWGGNFISLYLHDSGGTADLEKTYSLAIEYLFIMLIGLIPFSLEQAYSGTLRESGRAVLPMVSGIVAVVVNTVFNYFLIFGIGFFPRLGVRGAAIATVLSRIVQIAIVICWTHKNAEKLGFVSGLYKTLKVPLELAKRIVKKGLIPLMTNEFFWSAGVATLTQCYSVRGINVVAGLNIANTVINLFNVMFIALGAGIAVVMGQLLGAEEYKEAKKAAPRLIWFSGGMCLIVGVIMALLAKLFPQVYNTTIDVKSLASSFILISATLMPIHSMIHSVYFIVRAGGKTLITFLYDSGVSWGLVVPLAFVLSYLTDINIVKVYLYCQLVEIFKLIFGLIIIKKGIWISSIIADK